MVNELLVSLVNSVLSTGKRTSKGNQAYNCPFCHHHKPKLEINFTENKNGNNPWHCWVCGRKGLKLKALFKQCKATQDQYNQLFKLVRSGNNVIEVEYIEEKVELPQDFKTFVNNNSLEAKKAWSYLKSRGIKVDDILKYNIGYCSYGPYTDRIIIPSYDSSGNLNYFTSRAYKKDIFQKYKNPDVSRDIIPFEMFINWDLPLIICEGPFDALAIKRNVIPLFGKNIQPSLMKKIVSSRVKKIYIALDLDALKQALKFCEILINEGKEVYLVELKGKDPSEMGFEHFTKLIQNTPPLNQFTLMEKQFSRI